VGDGGQVGGGGKGAELSAPGQIVVEINNRIVKMKGQMQEHIDNVRHLRSEINKINQRLGGTG